MKIQKILHVVTTMNRGGLETMIMNYYRNIDRSKIQFDFLVHRDFKADYDDEIEELGGKIYRIPVLNPLSKSYLNALDTFFKEHKEYKAVHVHQDCLSSIACKYAMKNNIPVRIAHSHNANQDRNLKYILKRIYMQSIPKYATHLFACGKDAGDWMFRGKPYDIMNNAINTDLFIYDIEKRNKLRNELSLCDNSLVIGHVGRFNPQKNHHYLIDVFSEIHQLNKNSVLLLVGAGDMQKEIEDKVKDLELQDSVKFLGLRSDVNEVMQAMDAFVFPSHYEGLPVTLVEAQASGLPIFKSDNVPDQCIMTPNVISLSLDNTPKQWAETILDKMNTFERTNTYEYIKDAHFDIKENAKWLEEFYLNEVNKYE